MKIIITEEKKKKLFVPRNIDERREQLKKELGEKTKKILSYFNITKIRNHGRIDDYDSEIDSELHIKYGYSILIIDGKNYYGFPKNEDEEMIYSWEDTLAVYLNSIIPYSTEESLSKSSPNIVNRLYRVDITPSKIDVIFSYSIIEYFDKKGSDTISL
jgi:hypothetical protein